MAPKGIDSAITSITSALDVYRSDPRLARVLKEPFVRRMEVFAAALSLWGAKTNLTARPLDHAETAFHIADSLMPLVLPGVSSPEDSHPDDSRWLGMLAEAFATDRHILDFGSGAGFPGLILASACGARFTLVEARRKRASFLAVVAGEMGLDNVEILATKLTAEPLTPVFDMALSRASGPAAMFYQIAARVLRPTAVAILYSAPSQRLDLASASRAGLGNYHRCRYVLPRGSASVERSLSIWRR